MNMWVGKLLDIHIATTMGAPMQALLSAECVADKGIRGDRYYLGVGKFSAIPDAHDITLMDMEILDLVKNSHGVEIRSSEHRRNLTTLGVPIKNLVGKRFSIGSVILEGWRLNKPCAYLQLLLKKPVRDLLGDDCGLHCKIIEGGTIEPGDSIRPLEFDHPLFDR